MPCVIENGSALFLYSKFFLRTIIKKEAVKAQTIGMYRVRDTEAKGSF